MARVFRLGDNIDTDQLAPGRYMRGDLAELAEHCLETVRPDFARTVAPGDVIVAGRNFGAGSSREQAAEALKHLGVAAVIAESFAGIFYRNAVNLGLFAFVAADVSAIEDGDIVIVDKDAAKLRLERNGLIVPLEPLPVNLKALLADGGLVPHLKKRFRRQDEGERA